VASAAPAGDEADGGRSWRYGHGSYSERQAAVVGFEPFPSSPAVSGGGDSRKVDPSLGRASLHAQGGHAGRDGRWPSSAAGSPRPMVRSRSPHTVVQANSTQPQGGGVRGRNRLPAARQLGPGWLTAPRGDQPLGVEVRRGTALISWLTAGATTRTAGLPGPRSCAMEGADSEKNPNCSGRGQGLQRRPRRRAALPASGRLCPGASGSQRVSLLD